MQKDTRQDPSDQSLLNSDYSKMKLEYDRLLQEMEMLKLQFSEIENTNNHLISATWREREMKKLLTNTVDELNKTKSLLEAQNKRVWESINYSKKIQTAINATEQDLAALFSSSMILYRPKDIISGDFPWLFRRDEYAYVAAVDCTGHGVPGAMMSMIGNLILNDIVNDQGILTPGEILTKLHYSIVKTLKQDVPGSDSKDGMDIALCRINLNTNELIYSGAHRPLFLYRNGEIQVTKGDKLLVGGVQYKNKLTFQDHVFQIAKGEQISIFSDGYTDQFGGPNERKIMTKGLKELLEQSYSPSMPDLKNKLSTYFDEWMGDLKQLDDVLIITIGF
jgi:serine phosphatase RsbU (regulator of sigma subunit)